MCIRPRVLVCTIISSFNFATFFAVFTAVPGIFAKVYPAPSESRGLGFVGMVIGVVIGFTALTLVHLLGQFLRKSRVNRKGLPQFEKEKAAGNHVQMESRASITPLRHTPSDLSLSKATAETPTQNPGKDMDVAIAVANHLDHLSANKDKRIESERILSLLEQSLACEDFCRLLEDIDVKFDRATVARILADALPNGTKSVPPLAKPPAITISRLSTPTTDDQVWPLSPDSPQVIHPARESQLSRPPGRSRQRQRSSRHTHLYVTLTGSLLSTGGIFMFAWTVDDKLAWIIPVVALGIFACGGTLVFVSATEYLKSTRSSSEGEHAVTGCSTVRWVFAAAFSIIAVPLFNAIDTAWAASVLGFINAGAAVLAMLLLALDQVSKNSPERRSAA